MILKYLWIEEYKKFENIEINFNTNRTILEEEVFKNMRLTVLVGENGTGKTTILSFIAHIFRNLERYHERIPCDFMIRYFKEDNEIEIKKENEIIYFKIDNKKYILMKTIIQTGKKRKKYENLVYSLDSKTEHINYEDIQPYLPYNLVVSAFDIDYPKNYTHNYIGDRLYEISSIDLNYKESAINMGISLGVFRFLKEYFLENKSLSIFMKKMNFILSDKIGVYRNYFYFNNISRVFDSFYEEFDFEEWDEFLCKANLKSKDEFIDLICSDEYWSNFYEEVQGELVYENITNEYLNIDKYLNSNFYNVKVLEVLLEERLMYINDFFIVKDNIDIPLSNMSTGEKMFLCRIFYLLSEIEHDSIVILEEPEIHLNSAWVKQIISIITLLFNKYDIQLIISTHSHSFINNIFKENLLVINEETIEQPKINTFLANEKSINLTLFNGSKNNNMFEEKVLELIESSNKEEILELINILGESYYKYLAFKRLNELEEDYVESK